MISTTWVLVILLGVASGANPSMNTIPDFTSYDNCNTAGMSWKIAATEAKERNPRYVCFATETRLE